VKSVSILSDSHKSILFLAILLLLTYIMFKAQGIWLECMAVWMRVLRIRIGNKQQNHTLK